MPLSEVTKSWRRRRYAERRQQMLQILGPQCRRCGETRVELLEIDHIDPKDKKFEVSVACWYMAWDRVLVELAKCQALCRSCHTKKSITDIGGLDGRTHHGTPSSYRYCRCAICKAAHNETIKAYKHRTGRARQYRPRTGLVHGTANAYHYYKCRCDVCRTANTERHRKYRKQAPIV